MELAKASKDGDTILITACAPQGDVAELFKTQLLLVDVDPYDPRVIMTNDQDLLKKCFPTLNEMLSNNSQDEVPKVSNLPGPIWLVVHRVGASSK